MHPVLHALLPDKQGTTCEPLFASITRLVMRSVHCDYAVALMNAIKEGFPEAARKGYCFHLVQTMRKRLALTGAVHKFKAFAL